MSKIIGIDLGTTNSAVAITRDGAPQILPRGDERIIPSVVGYDASNGRWLVGTPARNQYVLAPENTVRSIKRKMGTDARLELGGRPLSPPEISAFILRELKSIAERHLAGEVSEAVITVPAYFNDAQRQATMDAGQIAGLRVRRIINEPTAAALAYGLNMAEDQLVLVYDLGGGTFDVSLVELMGGIVEVRASHGNTQLGGDDFDERLAGQLADYFANEHGLDLRQDRRAWARLLRAAENAKITLSAHPFAWVKEEYLAEKDGVPLHMTYEVSRQNFEEAITDLLEGTLESIEQVLSEANVTEEDISHVLLVGGSTRIPAVWELVANRLGIEPQMSVNPDEAVALGAGVQAAIIAGEPIDAILVDVTPHSLGIAVARNRFGSIISDIYQPLIRRNSTIPATREEIFQTMFPEQTAIRVEVYQGEAPVASANTLLGDFLVDGLEPPAPGERAQVTVQFDLNLDGILQVTARDRKTGRQENISVAATKARLSEAEILAASHHLRDLEEEDEADWVEEPETGALLVKAEALIVDEATDEETRTLLRSLLQGIRQARANADEEEAAELEEELLDLLFDLEE
ncbi:MAG: Hsp70 family protein [Chloroflexota bacterium]